MIFEQDFCTNADGLVKACYQLQGALISLHCAGLTILFKLFEAKVVDDSAKQQGLMSWTFNR